MHRGIVEPIGVVCTPQQLDYFNTTLSAAGFEVAWLETSFERAASMLEKIRVLLVEWPARAEPLRQSLLTILGSHRRPTMIIVGAPSHSDLFALAKGGVDAYVETLTPETLRATLALLSSSPHDRLRAAARASLGSVGLKDAQRLVRTEMFQEALVRENGNRHAAARLLRVDRRYVLKMAKDDDGERRNVVSVGKHR